MDLDFKSGRIGQAWTGGVREEKPPYSNACVSWEAWEKHGSVAEVKGRSGGAWIFLVGRRATPKFPHGHDKFQPVR